MKHEALEFADSFRVAIGNDRSQAAVMVLAPGASEGSPENRHSGADQWLFVVKGNGVATINGQELTLREGTLLLIEANDTHEIRNNGYAPLKTLNIYLPPAYDESADELPAARA